jgi:CRISPR/Cas system-associated exonuclease Cas4 (RecB family)
MASLSFSSASMYKDCPKKYQFQYVIKGKPSIKFNNRVYLEGDVVHKILEEQFLTGKPLDKEKALLTFEKHWAISYAHQLKQGIVQLFPNETLPGLKDKTKAMTGQAIDYLKAHKFDEGKYYNEFAIGAWNNPRPLGENLFVHGKADHVMDYGDHLGVYDFKTSKDTKYLHAEQIILYIIVIEKLLNKPVTEAAFIMFRNNESIPVRATTEDKASVLNELISISKNIDKAIFPAKPSEKLCGDCIFRLDCKDSMAKNAKSEASEAVLKAKPATFSLGEIQIDLL